MSIFDKIIGGIQSKTKLTQALMSLIGYGILSEHSKQRIRNTPELLTQDADLFLEKWMGLYTVSKGNDWNSWAEMFLMRDVLKNCREIGVDKAYSIPYPKVEEIFDSLGKILDVEIFEENGQKALEENQVLLSYFSLNLLHNFANLFKSSDDFEDLKYIVKFLDMYRSVGMEQALSEMRRTTNKSLTLLKIYSQRGKTIYDLWMMLKQYPHLLHPQFVEAFLRWGQSQKSPTIRQNFLDRYSFMKQVINSGFEVAYKEAQEQPEVTMLHETVLVFLASDSVDDAFDIVRKNDCMLLEQTLKVAEDIILDYTKKDPKTAQILKQRQDFLILIHSQGIDQAYLEISVIADPKKLEETLDLFLDRDWSDSEKILQEHPALLTDTFSKIIRKMINSSQEDGENELAKKLKKRLRLIEDYKKPSDYKQKREEFVAYIYYLLEKFLPADIDSAHLLVTQNPILMAEEVGKFIRQIAEAKRKEDEMFYIGYTMKGNLLRKCREIGIDQAFALYTLSQGADFIPDDISEGRKDAFEAIRKINLNPNQELDLSNIGIKLPTQSFDMLPHTLTNFLKLEEEKDIAQAILENPELLTSYMVAILKKHIETLTDPVIKMNIEKKLLILQTCKEKGIQATLSEFLD